VHYRHGFFVLQEDETLEEKKAHEIFRSASRFKPHGKHADYI